MQDETIATTEDQLLDEDARRSKLTVYLAKLVHGGAELEMQHGMRAVVVRTQRKRYVANVFLATLGVVGFVFTKEPLFVLGAGVALVGWHRKLVAGAEQIRMVIRVDETGRISEQVVDAT